MSHVTDVILTTFDGLGEDGDSKAMRELNDWCCDNFRGQCFLKPVDHDPTNRNTGGHKALQICIFVAAFNYINIELLWDKVKSIKWEDPECVSLMTCDEHEDSFTLRTIIIDGGDN